MTSGQAGNPARSKRNMNAQHTPGEWTIQRLPFSIAIYSSSVDLLETQEICTLPDRTPASEANARLIAAAPELLAACLQVLIASEDNGDMEDIDWKGLRAAVALATGKE